MANIIIGAAVFGLIGLAVFYVVKNRKRPCAGCPNGKNCPSCKNGGSCH